MDLPSFYLGLENDISEALLIIERLENSHDFLMYYHNGYELEFSTSEILFELENLDFNLRGIKRKMNLMYSHLKHNEINDRLEKELLLLLREGNVYSGLLQVPSFDDLFYSPILSILKAYASDLSYFISPSATSESFNKTQLLKQLLMAIPNILTDRSIVPSSEKDIQNEMYVYLKHIFLDLGKEESLPSILKSYRIDHVIPSLKCGIEYKYITNKEGVSHAIDGIFGDTIGYGGNEAWTNFYAVFYMTENYISQAAIENMFEMKNVSENWTPILVIGNGERKSKKTSEAPKSQKKATQSLE